MIGLNLQVLAGKWTGFIFWIVYPCLEILDYESEKIVPERSEQFQEVFAETVAVTLTLKSLNDSLTHS